MKRQLSIQYEDMVNFINDKKKRLRLAQIITYLRLPTKKYSDILYKLYADKNDTDEMLDYAIPIIVDIYNGNYELEEPKYYWRLNLQGVSCTYYYAVRIESLNGRFGLDEYKYDESEFTENELIDALSNTDTNLAINDFIPVEVIE